MRSAVPLMLAAALSILPFVVGCQTMKSESITVQTPIVETPQDETLSRSVRDRLLADKKVDLTGVKIVSSGGTVYLSGEVKSLEARQQAIKLAWEVPGVQSVVNTLEVEK
jgi:osmotically-inducible protein OsmY